MQLDLITKNDLVSLKTDLLAEITNILQQHHPKPVLDTIRAAEARKILQCSEGKLHTLLKSGALPYTKVLGTIYIKREDVINLIQNPKK